MKPLSDINFQISIQFVSVVSGKYCRSVEDKFTAGLFTEFVDNKMNVGH